MMEVQVDLADLEDGGEHTLHTVAITQEGTHTYLCVVPKDSGTNREEGKETETNNEEKVMIASCEDAYSVVDAVSELQPLVPHVSIMAVNGAWPLQECADPACGCKLYHCPLCKPGLVRVNYLNAMRKHFSHHLDKGVTLEGFHLLRCRLQCVDDQATPHLHCPCCGKLIVGRSKAAMLLQAHLGSCDSQPHAGEVHRLGNGVVPHHLVDKALAKQEIVNGQVNYPHTSIVPAGEAFALSPCEQQDCACGHYHCPLCISVTLKFRSKASIHANSHDKHFIDFQGFRLLLCCLPCVHYQDRRVSGSDQPVGHYHCPMCGRTLRRKVDMFTHVHGSCKGRGLMTAALPDVEGLVEIADRSRVPRSATTDVKTASGVIFEEAHSWIGEGENEAEDPHSSPTDRLLAVKQEVNLDEVSPPGGVENDCSEPNLDAETLIDEGEPSTPPGGGASPRHSAPEPSPQSSLTPTAATTTAPATTAAAAAASPTTETSLVSVVRVDKGLSLSQCLEPPCACRLYHCPLCPPDDNTFKFRCLIKKHSMLHVKRHIPFKDQRILGCALPCDVTGPDAAKLPGRQSRPVHFHCPSCRQAWAQRHLCREHLEGPCGDKAVLEDGRRGEVVLLSPDELSPASGATKRASTLRHDVSNEMDSTLGEESPSVKNSLRKRKIHHDDDVMGGATKTLRRMSTRGVACITTRWRQEGSPLAVRKRRRVSGRGDGDGQGEGAGARAADGRAKGDKLGGGGDGDGTGPEEGGTTEGSTTGTPALRKTRKPPPMEAERVTKRHTANKEEKKAGRKSKRSRGRTDETDVTDIDNDDVTELSGDVTDRSNDDVTDPSHADVANSPEADATEPVPPVSRSKRRSVGRGSKQRMVSVNRKSPGDLSSSERSKKSSPRKSRSANHADGDETGRDEVSVLHVSPKRRVRQPMTSPVTSREQVMEDACQDACSPGRVKTERQHIDTGKNADQLDPDATWQMEEVRLDHGMTFETEVAQTNRVEIFDHVCGRVSAAVLQTILPGSQEVALRHLATETGAQWRHLQESDHYLLEGSWNQLDAARRLLQDRYQPGNSPAVETGLDECNQGAEDATSRDFLPLPRPGQWTEQAAETEENSSFVETVPPEDAGQSDRSATDGGLDKGGERRKVRLHTLLPRLALRDVRCPVCDKRPASRQLLVRHLCLTQCRNLLRKSNASRVERGGVLSQIADVVLTSADAVPEDTCPVCARRFADRGRAVYHHLMQACYVSKGGTGTSGKVKEYGIATDPATGLFVCPHCGQRKLSGHAMVTHVESKHLVREKPCAHCNKLFSTEEHLSRHVQSTHAQASQRRVVCHLCGVTTVKTNIERHLQVKHGEKTRRFACGRCSFTTHMADNLVAHERNFHGPRRHACAVCGKRFAGAGTLRQHEAWVHQTTPGGANQRAARRRRAAAALAASKQSFVSCPQCRAVLMRKNLPRHVKIVHQGVKDFACDQCARSFASRSSLRQHSLVHRVDGNNDRLYLHQCDTCGQGFNRLYYYREHVENAHTGARPYSCGQCGHTFRYRVVLEKHMEVHEDGSKACDLCQRVFSTTKQLKVHMRIKHACFGYKCPCGITLATKAASQQHAARCSGNKKDWLQGPVQRPGGKVISLLPSSRNDPDPQQAAAAAAAAATPGNGDPPLQEYESTHPLQQAISTMAAPRSPLQHHVMMVSLEGSTVVGEEEEVEGDHHHHHHHPGMDHVTIATQHVVPEHEDHQVYECIYEPAGLVEAGGGGAVLDGTVLMVYPEQVPDSQADQMTVVGGRDLVSLGGPAAELDLSALEAATTVESVEAPDPDPDQVFHQGEDATENFMCSHCQSIFTTVEEATQHIAESHVDGI